MLKRNSIIVMIVLLFIGCATMNVGQVPWTLDIQNWSSHQKANFFMTTWMAEKYSFDSMNAMEDKPDDLLKVLEEKRKILEGLRIPIRVYVQIVNAGNLPTQDSEQEIIVLLKQLQTNYIYGG